MHVYGRRMSAVDTANTGTAAVQKFPGEPVAKRGAKTLL